MTDKLTAGALFAGIGGFCAGFEEGGFSTSWATDQDPASETTYRENFPHTRFALKDIRDLTVDNDELKPVDVLHAGFPCQSFSKAGNRQGFSDPRGQLFYELVRVIREFGTEKPSVLVFENTPYLRIGDGGAWFIEIQREIKRAGYWFRSTSCAELNPFDLTDSPQDRNRLFMLAFATDRFRNGRIEFPKGMHDPVKDLKNFVNFDGVENEKYYLPEDNRYYNMISRHIDNQPRLYQLRKYEVRPKAPNICPTLTANMGLGGHNVPFLKDRKGVRKLTEYECARLQGFPENYCFPENVNSGKRYEQIGNSVSVPIATLLAGVVRRKIKEERDL